MSALASPNMNLALVGNCNLSVLVNERGEMTWACMPRADGDAVFCSLLRRNRDEGEGFFAVDLADFSHAEQEYLANTAVLVTRLYDTRGACVEIVDTAPRFRQFGRLFAPQTLVRQLRRVSGSPRITVRLRPAHNYGAQRAGTTVGSNHIRYLCGGFVLRATTDCSLAMLLEEIPFLLQGPMAIILGPDETLMGSVAEVARRFLEETASYWQDWVRDLSIPFEWQEAIIRAAITLKLTAVDDTGAIMAAVTTSLPEAADSGRNWDYRFCWLRDAYFTVNALNRLNATRTMERYLGYIINIIARSQGKPLQPCYGINGLPEMEEREVTSLAGYRGMGPVRVGNAAYTQVQNDVYGSAVLAATHVFFDRRLLFTGNADLFRQFEQLGEHAAELWNVPDAGLWELRGSSKVHTFSSVMCWVACDRLAKIAVRLGLAERAAFWRGRAERIHAGIVERAWSDKLGGFSSTLDGHDVDASMLLLAELGFLKGNDPRFAGTVAIVERELRRGDFIFRYGGEDDFGVPQNAFVVCTGWYVDALARVGRRDEARVLFENLLACRNPHGLLPEHIDPRTRELWGNFPQTYSMVALINCATRLSIHWDEAF